MLVRYTKHAILRVHQRSCEFGMDVEEAFRRVEETALESRLSMTKYSKRSKVFYKYYPDNISFVVICRKSKSFWIVKTVIMKHGRE